MTEELPVDSGIIFLGFLSSIIIFVVDILGLIRDPPPLLQGHSSPQAGGGHNTGGLVRGESVIEPGGLGPVL